MPFLIIPSKVEELILPPHSILFFFITFIIFHDILFTAHYLSYTLECNFQKGKDFVVFTLAPSIAKSGPETELQDQLLVKYIALNYSLQIIL